MVRLLVDHGALMSTHDRTISTRGIGTSPPSHGAAHYATLGGWTPLLFSARRGWLESAPRSLGRGGADLNSQDPDLVPPVVTAIVNGHYDVAAYPIEKGADVESGRIAGARAALWAAKWTCTYHAPLQASPDVVESEAVGGTELLNPRSCGTWRRRAGTARCCSHPHRSHLADRGSGQQR